MKNTQSKTVSLILGSGGARGYAHIGAIEVLEENGYKIESIAGSSMGALVGGIYAAGKLEEYKKWVLTLDYYDVYKLIKFSPSSGGVIDVQKVFDKIVSMIGDVNIEDLSVKYRAVATDINTREAVVFDKGKLIDAMRASISISTVFVPVHKNDMILVDGGILNPLPINLASEDNTDVTIAVNLDANIEDNYKITIPQEQLTREEVLIKKYDTYVKQAESFLPLKLLDIVDKYTDDMFKKKEIEKRTDEDIFSILGKTLDTAQSVLSQYILQDHKADIIIEIPRESCEFYEFTQAYRMIEIGKMATSKALSM